MDHPDSLPEHLRAEQLSARARFYDTAGRPALFTSYNTAEIGPTTVIVNQVLREYNGLSQLVREYQSHSGAVDTSRTLKVQYAYSEMSDGAGQPANHSRMLRLTYPNGRVLNYTYTNAAGLDDTISRLSALTDSSATLENYSYLGLGTVVIRAHPEPGVDLTYVQAGGSGDGGDQYVGLDRFGRVLDQRWQRTRDNSYTDRFRYGYDRDSNRLYRENAQGDAAAAAFSELYHASGVIDTYDPQDQLLTVGYDKLNQLTDFSRGTLNAARDAMASPSRSQSWLFDGLGNWGRLTTTNVGQATTMEDRTHNQQNQITAITGIPGRTTPAYDNNGNTTRNESNRVLRYDAWNRLAGVEDDRGALLASYRYDALNRRVTEGLTGAAVDLYYSAAWQVLEERAGGATVAQAQYVWSPVYVDALVLRDRGTERLYPQQEANWNVTALVDRTGNVVERYVQDPYGAVTVLTPEWAVRGSGSQFAWVYLHQGGRFEAVSALYHFRNRDLSPTLGRWIQRDPAGYADGTNLYSYQLSNPIDGLDPLGLVKATIRIDFGRFAFVTDHYYEVVKGKQGNYLHGILSVTRTPHFWISASVEADAIRRNDGRLELGDVTTQTDSQNVQKFTFPQSKHLVRWKKAGESALDAIHKDFDLAKGICVQCKSSIYQISYKKEPGSLGFLGELAFEAIPGHKVVAKVSKALGRFLGHEVLETEERQSTLILLICADGKRSVAALNLPTSDFKQSPEVPIPSRQPPTKGVTTLHTRSSLWSLGVTTEVTSSPLGVDSINDAVYEASD